MMKTGLKKFSGAVFYSFLLFLVFGVFLLYVFWMWRKNPVAPNPAGADYVIPYAVSPLYPSAFYYGFEGPVPQGATADSQAFSGHHSLVATDAQHPPAVINLPLEALNPDQMHYIRLSAWLKSDQVFDAEEAQLILLITNPLRDVKYSKTIKLRHNPRNSWFHADTWAEPLNYRFDREDRLRIYIKNTSKANILVDDLVVQFGLKPGPGAGGSCNQPVWDHQATSVNVPPYRPLFLEYAGTASGIRYEPAGDTVCHPADLLDARIVVAGSFFPARTGPGELLAIDRSGRLICLSAQLPGPLVMRSFALPDSLWAKSAGQKIVSGDFDGDRLLEFVIVESLAHRASLIEGRRDGKGESLVCSTVDWPVFPALQQILALDADGDRKDELIRINTRGEWQLSGLSKGSWVQLASSSKAINAWKAGRMPVSMTVHPGYGSPQGPFILSVSNTDGRGTASYACLRYDRKKSDFGPVFKNGQETGKETGSDRPAMNDLLIPVNWNAGNCLQFLRIRDDWRFDVKLLSLNDTAYSVDRTIDFTGYPEDNNPKYDARVLFLPWGNIAGRPAVAVLHGNVRRAGRSGTGAFCLDFYRMGDIKQP